MGNFSFKLSPEKIAVLKETFRNDIKESKNEYMDTLIQNNDVTISIYKSGKVVFQGNDAFFYASAYIDTKKSRQAGSDEVGTGDYFGPVVVCAAIIEESDYEYVNEKGITDSKQMTDDQILKIGAEVMKRFKHSLLILDNEKYNQIHETNNLNMIKAKMHNQAYCNLIKKGYSIPKAAYVDQFAPEYTYYEYLKFEKEVYHDLTFETKAEEKYPAVAVASVISRYAFLIKMEELNAKYKMNFHKGAGDEVDRDAYLFVQKYGKDALSKVAKMHFKNTEKISLISQK